MDNCRLGLVKWRRDEVGRPNRVFPEQCKKLAVLQGEENNPDLEQASKIQNDFKLLMKQEELKWRQRAKVDWLKFGDKKSKFYHACANQRCKVNKISNISDDRA